MKKYFYLTVLSALVAGCTSDGIIEQLPETPNTQNGGAETDMPMGFVVSSKNMTRATMLQDVGIYNFGVFAYKSSETSYSVMDNYLVGYMNTAKRLPFKLPALRNACTCIYRCNCCSSFNELYASS